MPPINGQSAQEHLIDLPRPFGFGRGAGQNEFSCWPDHGMPSCRSSVGVFVAARVEQVPVLLQRLDKMFQ